MNFMKKWLKVLFAVGFGALFMLVGAINVSAQNDLFFGQNHFYTVIFRGNSESVVYAKLVFTNSEDKPISDFSFTMPGASSDEMVAYQMKLPQQCIQYDYLKPESPCIQYRDADYLQNYQYYPYGNSQKTEYQKLQFTKSGGLYKLTLATPVEPNKSAAVIVAYAAKGYVEESAGLFKFNFETLKVPARINQIRVTVDVDSDLFLKGKRASVDYGTRSFGVADLAAPSAVSSGSLDNVVSKIGSYGPIMKNASNLFPNESFIVRGEYATSWVRLYIGSILMMILVVAILLTIIYFMSCFLKKRHESVSSVTAASPNSSANPMQNSFPGLPVHFADISHFTNALLGLLSAVLVIVLSASFNGFMNFLQGIIGFNVNPAFLIIGFIAIILVYLLVIFGPAIFAMSRHGWRAFLLIILAEFLWLIIFLILYLLLFQSGIAPNYFGPQPIIEPMM